MPATNSALMIKAGARSRGHVRQRQPQARQHGAGCTIVIAHFFGGSKYNYTRNGAGFSAAAFFIAPLLAKF
jgi:hypothetical protein